MMIRIISLNGHFAMTTSFVLAQTVAMYISRGHIESFKLCARRG